MRAQEIAARYNLRRSGGEYRGNCPFCGYKDGFHVEDRDGRTLWFCNGSCSREELTAKLGSGAPAVEAAQLPALSRESNTTALRLWHAGRPWQGTPVAAWLEFRGVTCPPDAPLRYMPDARHRSGGRFPAMLALMVGVDGKQAALHRTFLAPGGRGKAPVDPGEVRMNLGRPGASAVRLFAATDSVILAEGIETALAASEVIGAPAWAATNANHLRHNLQLPPQIRTVIVAADNDQPGLTSARGAAARFRAEGRSVRLAIPEARGADFNAVLTQRKARDAG
jgi:hypothetical protein